MATENNMWPIKVEYSDNGGNILSIRLDGEIEIGRHKIWSRAFSRAAGLALLPIDLESGVEMRGGAESIYGIYVNVPKDRGERKELVFSIPHLFGYMSEVIMRRVAHRTGYLQGTEKKNFGAETARSSMGERRRRGVKRRVKMERGRTLKQTQSGGRGGLN